MGHWCRVLGVRRNCRLAIGPARRLSLTQHLTPPAATLLGNLTARMANVVVETLAVAEVETIAVDAVALATALLTQPLSWVVPVAVMMAALTGHRRGVAAPGQRPAGERGDERGDGGTPVHEIALRSYPSLLRCPMLDHSSRAWLRFSDLNWQRSKH
jgi:hypothetical protein